MKKLVVFIAIILLCGCSPQSNEELQSFEEERQSEYDALQKAYTEMSIQLENKSYECRELLVQVNAQNNRIAEFEAQIKEQENEIIQLKTQLSVSKEKTNVNYYKLIERNNFLEQIILVIYKGNNSFEINDENLSWLMNTSKAEVMDALGYRYTCFGDSFDDLEYYYPDIGIRKNLMTMQAFRVLNYAIMP